MDQGLLPTKENNKRNNGSKGKYSSLKELKGPPFRLEFPFKAPNLWVSSYSQSKNHWLLRNGGIQKNHDERKEVKDGGF